MFSMPSQNTRRKVRLNEKVESRVRGDLYARFGGECLETYHCKRWQGAGCLAYVNTKERGAIVKRLPSEIFPEYILVRVNEFDKVAVTPLEEWVRYLKDGIITSETTAPGLEEAREKLRYYSMSPEERYAYDEHLNAIMIQNDVLSTAKFEGWEEGRAEERLETARRMRSDGLSMEMVVRYTGLSEEEINNL